ncbi:MAG: hypothetical protein RLZZ511_4140 [Cyanobacteriota bacterium]|jgi:hypothetical protein
MITAKQRFRIAAMNTKTRTQGKFALWKADPDRKFVFTGKLQLDPDIIAEIIAQSGNGRNEVELDLIGFRNDSDKPNAPKYSGYASFRDAAPAKQQADEDW